MLDCIFDVSKIVAAQDLDISVNCEISIPKSFNTKNQLAYISFLGKLYKKNDKLLLSGNLEGNFISECALCLKETKQEIFCDVSEVFAKNTQNDDEWPIVDNKIDILPVLTINFITAFPLRVLCKPDCLGLCPMCGKDINARDCGCDRRKSDDRLDVLKNWNKEAEV